MDWHSETHRHFYTYIYLQKQLRGTLLSRSYPSAWQITLHVPHRYLVATRDIKPGEVILKEKPLVVGPRVDSFPICLACYRPLPLYQEARCSRCLVAPVCGVHCERQGAHGEPECTLLKEAAKEYPTLLSDHSQIVLPLRCLLKLRNAPTDSKWTSFLELESHEEKRRNTLIWRDHQLNIVEVSKESVLTN